MNYKRTVNGLTITVKKWANDVVITDSKGNTLAVKSFSDHVKAVAVARAL